MKISVTILALFLCFSAQANEKCVFVAASGKKIEMRSKGIGAELLFAAVRSTPSGKRVLDRIAKEPRLRGLKVRFDASKLGANASGTTDLDNKIITLDPNAEFGAQVSTFFHELVHLADLDGHMLSVSINRQIERLEKKLKDAEKRETQGKPLSATEVERLVRETSGLGHKLTELQFKLERKAWNATYQFREEFKNFLPCYSRYLKNAPPEMYVERISDREIIRLYELNWRHLKAFLTPEDLAHFKHLDPMKSIRGDQRTHGSSGK